jgi:hypothetical protein
MGSTIEESEFDSWQMQDIFLFIPSKQALGPTQRSIQWITSGHFIGGKGTVA